METTRRSFLKLLAVAGVSATSPAVLKLVSDDAALKPEQTLVGMAREIVHLDLGWSQLRVRIDIKAGQLQIGVDGLIDSINDLDRFRCQALALLQGEIDSRGISVDALEPLLIPVGYTAPA